MSATHPSHGNAHKRSHYHPPRWQLLALIAVIGGVVGGLIVHWTTGSGGSGTALSSAQACNAQRVASEDLRSVVTITAAGGSGTSGTGSGSVIDAKGYILTNNHVISPAASGGVIQVLFANGERASAIIVGRDPLTDLAVIKPDTTELPPAVSFGSSAAVAVGQPVVALGAPLGLTSTVTTGIVSALNRTVRVPGENNADALLVGAIQTDAAINPGNSGGALVNCAGQLIGVPSAGAAVPNESGQTSSGSVGLGFAIPSDFAKTIAGELIANGKVTHASFGMAVAPVSRNLTATTEEDGLADSGLYVGQLTAGGPAAKAGLQVGDVITKLDGQTATTERLAELTLTKRPGEKVSIEFERDGQSRTVELTLAARA